MTTRPFRQARRRALAAPLALLPLAAPAQEKRVAEDEPQAQALGYKHDASKVDKAKLAKYEPGQVCATCNFFKGKPGQAWGPCDIFAGREVNAKGWCSAWVKKAL